MQGPSAKTRLDLLGDEDLVRRCAAGDDRAWEALVLRYRRLVYAIPVRSGLAPEAADDVFQTVFARLAERVRDLQNPGRVRAWLVTTARRLTLDAVSRRQRVELDEVALERFPDAGPLPDSELERLQDQHLVRQALNQLSERCHDLLRRLYYSEEERPSYEGVAKDLGMPVGSIGPTRARCLEKLLAEFERLRAATDTE